MRRGDDADVEATTRMAMADDIYYHQGAPVPRPRIFRIARLYAKPGREFEVIRRVERITRDLRVRHADVAFRSYLARSYCEDGTCEVLAVSVYDRPEDMRHVLTNEETATRPFAVAEYAEALERWTVTTYEVFYPQPEDD